MVSTVRPGLAGLVRVPAPVTRPASDSDEALIERIAAGDRLAMRAVYARYHVRVYRFVLGLVKDPMLAEDLISQVFLDVWQQAGRFQARCTLGTWLLAIARNQAISALRRRARADKPLHAALLVEDSSDDPEVSAEKADRGETIRACLASLSPIHREIIDLVYYHDKSSEEVAAILAIPAPTVKTRMFYARKHLGELLTSAGIDRAAI